MINFLKRNWAVIVLVIVGVMYLKNNFLGTRYSMSSIEPDYMPASGTGVLSSAKMGSVTSNYSVRSPAPSESSDRLIIQDTGLSLQVKDVAKSIDEIENTTKEFGGFLITSHLSKPEGAASGNISVRVPEDKRKEAMTAYKNMAVKVVSESVNGTDVTDQYTDLQAQLDVLQKTKIKFEDILDRATAVNDLLNVQQQLISLQSQIDNVKGQQKYYEQSAKLSKITIYLSTDELALPYAPTNEWRPTVIFKEAVRSLVGAIRGIGSLAIWAIVFLPIIIPIFFIVRYIKRRKNISSNRV
jgi:hypothetical protein